METLVDFPLILPRQHKMLTLTHSDKDYPLEQQLVLVACKLRGHPLETEVFQQRLPECSWRRG